MIQRKAYGERGFTEFNVFAVDFQYAASRYVGGKHEMQYFTFDKMLYIKNSFVSF